MSHTKFTSIESFAHIYRGQKRFLDPEYTLNPAKVRYGAKIKLHGTNAAVRIMPDGAVIAQGRNRDLFVGEDQFGFAVWVAQYEDEFNDFADEIHEGFVGVRQADEPIIVHGEWAGRGIQKKDAVTQLDDKYFFVFAVEIDGMMCVEPDYIESYLPDLDHLIVLPWEMQCMDVLDFADKGKCGFFADWASTRAEEVGEVDPFIKEVFEIEGPGEGLVFTPLGPAVPRDIYGTLTFKAKTKDHGVKAGKAATRDLVIPEGVPEFVTTFVTPARCEQALTEACEGVAEVQRTGDFLKWMGQDVKKESAAEIEDGELSWKDVSSSVTKAAREWFLEKCAVV